MSQVIVHRGSGTGTNANADLVGMTWGAPGAEVGNAIEISGTLTDFAGSPLTSSLTDVEITVSDSSVDCEPSATATLSAGTVAVGSVLAGTGTARMVMRTDAGSLKVKVSETAAANRYLWIRQGGNARLWVRSLTGVVELIFT